MAPLFVLGVITAFIVVWWALRRRNAARTPEEFIKLSRARGCGTVRKTIQHTEKIVGRKGNLDTYHIHVYVDLSSEGKNGHVITYRELVSQFYEDGAWEGGDMKQIARAMIDAEKRGEVLLQDARRELSR